MLRITELLAPRLKLRRYLQPDIEPFAAMNADVDVMRYYLATWPRERSDAFAQREMRLIAEHGWGFC